MHLARTSICGSPHVGFFGIVTNRWGIFPPAVKEVLLEKAEKIFDIDYIAVTSISNSPLAGLFCVGNSNGIILPYIVEKSEIKHIEKSFEGLGLNIAIIQSELTALTNLFSANDKICIADIVVPKEICKTVEDILDVEVVRFRFEHQVLSGACLFITDKGGVIYPDATENEIEELKNITGLHIQIATVNHGSPYVNSGIIANSHGFIVGDKTTGPEIARIDEALGFIKTYY